MVVPVEVEVPLEVPGAVPEEVPLEVPAEDVPLALAACAIVGTNTAAATTPTTRPSNRADAPSKNQ